MKNLKKNLLFTLNYGFLNEETNLHFSSGLEGYIARLIANKINVHLKADKNDEGIIFEIRIPAN